MKKLFAKFGQQKLEKLHGLVKYGKKEVRVAQSQQIELINSLYTCPVCQNNVNGFLPLPAFYGENLEKYGWPHTFDDAETMNAERYNCPHCGESDRNRLYALYLKERISTYPSRDKIFLLDIAPSQPLSEFINRFKNVIHHTADLLVEEVDFVIDITNMPEIASDTYDILICSHVLEHVNDDKKALSELYRVLKPSGWGIIMVPIILTIDDIDEDPEVNDIAERWRRFGQDDHVRLYSKHGFIQRVQNAGFTLKQLGIDHFGKSAFQKYGITEKSILYIAEKP